MKKVSLILCTLALISLAACGQTEKNVPEKVKTAFVEKFPDIKKVKWNYEEDEGWEAEFKVNGIKYSATYNDNGDWLETEYEVDYNKIPPIVKTTLDIEYKEYKVKESEISETASGKVYEFELEKDKSLTEVVIDTDGNVVKKENPAEEEDDD
jgi:hypothetical protein